MLPQCPAAGFFEFAQMQSEAELLVVRQRLIAKHKNGIFGHSGVNGCDHVGRQWLPAIDTRHFACESGGKLSDR